MRRRLTKMSRFGTIILLIHRSGGIIEPTSATLGARLQASCVKEGFVGGRLIYSEVGEG